MNRFSLLVALCAVPVSAQTAYLADSNLDILYTVDLNTAAVTAIGSTLNNGLGTPADLAWREDTKELYVIDLGTGAVGTIDPATATFTSVFLTGTTGWQGMCWDPIDKVFWLANQNDSTYVLDPATGLTTQLANSGFGLITALDCDALGRVWGIDFTTGAIVQIDKGTGVGSSSVSTVTNIQGLSIHPDGTWYAVNTTTDSLYVIDPITGASLLIGPNTGTQFAKGFQISDTGLQRGGHACPDGNQESRRAIATGSSALGGTINFSFESGTAPVPGFLLFGFSNSYWGPLPLPADLSGFGAPGCWLYTSIDVVAGPTVSGVPFPLVVPTAPFLVGGVMWYQVAELDLSSSPNPLGLVYSDVIRVVFTN